MAHSGRSYCYDILRIVFCIKIGVSVNTMKGQVTDVVIRHYHIKGNKFGLELILHRSDLFGSVDRVHLLKEAPIGQTESYRRGAKAALKAVGVIVNELKE